MVGEDRLGRTRRPEQRQDERGDADDGPEIAFDQRPAAAQAITDVQDIIPGQDLLRQRRGVGWRGRGLGGAVRARGRRCGRGGGDGLDGGLYLAGLLVAQLRLLLQRVQHHFVQAHIHLHLARGRRESAQGQLAREHLVEDDAEGIDVGPVVHGLRLLHLLGRHVVGRADDVPRAGERRLPSAVRPSILAMPKSVIFTRPFLSSRMFSGLMSRWTMPSLWANWSASQICGTIASACSGVSRPACSICRRLPPSTNSITR